MADATTSCLFPGRQGGASLAILDMSGNKQLRGRRSLDLQILTLVFGLLLLSQWIAVTKRIPIGGFQSFSQIRYSNQKSQEKSPNVGLESFKK
jgi:hypothetical protein